MGFFDGITDRVRRGRPGQFHVEAHGAVLIDRAFVRGAGRVRDVRPANHKAHDLLLEEMRRNFDSDGAYASGGWDELALSTIRQKQAAGMDNGILNRTGRFKASWTEKGHPDQHVENTRRGLVVESTVEYGPFHQDGTDRMPARPQQLTESARRQFVGIYHRHAMGLPL